MAEFDKSLDKELFATEAKLETTRFKIAVMSYNEGRQKVQINREIINNDDGEWKWVKLGRLTKEELEVVVPALKEALDNME